MSTNYYWHTDPCGSCGRTDEPLHIYQTPSGFEGHFRWNPDTGEYDPWLVSWADWKAWLLAADGGRIIDEYGREHTVAEFVEFIESVPMDRRRRQYDYVTTRYRPGMLGSRGVGIGKGLDWLDPDGFTFYGGEFS